MSEESTKESVSKQGALGPNERWSARRKRDVTLRLLRGEPLDAVSREVGVEIYRLEQWRDKALLGIDEALKDRTGDPLQTALGGNPQEQSPPLPSIGTRHIEAGFSTRPLPSTTY